MTLTPIQNTHVFLDESGVPRLFPSHVKVRLVVEGLRNNPCSPEEYVRNYPHLHIAEVYAAMAYYHDHRAEMDEEIRRLNEFAEQMRAATPEAPATKRVRAIMEKRRESLERE